MAAGGGPFERPLPLRAVTRLLIGYGAVGLVAAAIGVAFLVIGLTRVNALADRVDQEFGGVSTVLDRMATALDDAATSAGGFVGTIDASTTALSTAASDLRAIVPQLRDLEVQANAVNVLGSQPLAPLGSLFGQIAGQMDDLDERLDTVSTALTTNRAALEANSTSLADLARETRTLGDNLGGDALGSALDDARWLLLALLVVATVGAIVPAAGALAAGLWLRRRLRDERDALGVDPL